MTSIRPQGWPAGRQWAACGASVTGSTHRQRGLGCDDAYGYGIAGDFVVAAVADGAGSVSGTSAWGAHVACQSVLDDALQPSFVEGCRTWVADDVERMLRWLFARALERVQLQAEAMRVDVSLLSTTLCVALAHRDLVVFGQVGDGVIAAESSGRIETLLIEEKDGYANTTSFVQSERALEVSLRTVRLGDVTAFALSTDGMSYKITNVATGEAYEPFFRGCWQHLRIGANADDFGTMLDGIEDDQTGDDKTMVLAVTQDGVGQRGVEWPVVDSSAPPPGDYALVAPCSVESEAPTRPVVAVGAPFGQPPARRRRWGRKRR